MENVCVVYGMCVCVRISTELQVEENRFDFSALNGSQA